MIFRSVMCSYRKVTQGKEGQGVLTTFSSLSLFLFLSLLFSFMLRSEKKHFSQREAWTSFYPRIQFKLPCITRTIFNGCQIVYWDPPECETKVSSKNFWFGLSENAWFPWQPIAGLRMGVCLQKYSHLNCYLS